MIYTYLRCGKTGMWKGWKYENMEIWKYGNMEIWKYGENEIKLK